ncbi:unnamed protein product [Choristocarpus tenellus]
MISGELFVRSTPELFEKPGETGTLPSYPRDETDFDSRMEAGVGMLAGASKEFRQLILGHQGCGEGVIGEEVSVVSRAWREQRAMRLQRIEGLIASKQRASSGVKIRLNAVRKAADGLRRGQEACARRLDTQLCRLVLRYAAAAEDEMAVVYASEHVERIRCRQEVERLRLSGRLASFAAAVEQHTRGAVVLKRLQHAHPQHMRCRRAATENVKTGFFSPRSPYKGVRVLEVYKIENHFLLERFHRAAKAAGPCKVKGLFCCIPDNSLEHVVLHGMGPGPRSGLQPRARHLVPGSSDVGKECRINHGSSGGVSSIGTDLDKNGETCVGITVEEEGSSGVEDDPWFGLTRWLMGRQRVTVDHLLPSQSVPLDFPRAFSRHSTLEEELLYANGGTSYDWEGQARVGVDRSKVRVSPGGGTQSAGRLGVTEEEERGAVGGGVGVEEGARAGEGAVEGHGSGKAGSSVTAAAAKADQHQPGADSSIRILALCRVMIGNIFVSTESPVPVPGSPTPLPPTPSGHDEFDSVYYPLKEEYSLLKDSHILPEFLVVYQYAARDKREFAAVPPLSSSDGASAVGFSRGSPPSPKFSVGETVNRAPPPLLPLGAALPRPSTAVVAAISLRPDAGAGTASEEGRVVLAPRWDQGLLVSASPLLMGDDGLREPLEVAGKDGVAAAGEAAADEAGANEAAEAAAEKVVAQAAAATAAGEGEKYRGKLGRAQRQELIEATNTAIDLTWQEMTGLCREEMKAIQAGLQSKGRSTACLSGTGSLNKGSTSTGSSGSSSHSRHIQ